MTRAKENAPRKNTTTHATKCGTTARVSGPSMVVRAEANWQPSQITGAASHQSGALGCQRQKRRPSPVTTSNMV